MKRAAIHARAMKRKAEMLKLRAQRYTIKQIAAKYNISPTRVMQIIGRTKRGMEQVTK